MKTLFEGQPVSSLRPEESQLLWTQCWQSKRTAGVNLAYLFAMDSLKATGQQLPEKLRFFPSCGKLDRKQLCQQFSSAAGQLIADILVLPDYGH